MSIVDDLLLAARVERYRAEHAAASMWDHAETAWMEGASGVEIADACGVSESTVSRRFSGLAPRSTQRRPSRSRG